MFGFFSFPQEVTRRKAIKNSNFLAKRSSYNKTLRYQDKKLNTQITFPFCEEKKKYKKLKQIYMHNLNYTVIHRDKKSTYLLLAHTPNKSYHQLCNPPLKWNLDGLGKSLSEEHPNYKERKKN